MSHDDLERPSHVIEDLIVAWHDCQQLRGELDAAQMRYGRLVERLKPLAHAGQTRTIYHDGYVCGIGYVPMILNLYPHGTVHLACVEKGNQLRWPEPENEERPGLHHVSNGGSIQSPLTPDPVDLTEPPAPEIPRGRTAGELWDRLWDGDDTLVLSQEVVRAALAPDDLLDSHLDG